jgi:hypothetical protein
MDLANYPGYAGSTMSLTDNRKGLEQLRMRMEFDTGLGVARTYHITTDLIILNLIGGPDTSIAHCRQRHPWMGIKDLVMDAFNFSKFPLVFLVLHWDRIEPSRL